MEQAVARQISGNEFAVLRTVDSDERRDVERYISKVFEERFSARLESFLPGLVAVRSEAGMRVPMPGRCPRLSR